MDGRVCPLCAAHARARFGVGVHGLLPLLHCKLEEAARFVDLLMVSAAVLGCLLDPAAATMGADAQSSRE